tara:strand:+ start:1520 stop:1795 length:276 start_codon:yes stop_codon:yes gene_type:complete
MTKAELQAWAKRQIDKEDQPNTNVLIYKGEQDYEENNDHHGALFDFMLFEEALDHVAPGRMFCCYVYDAHPDSGDYTCFDCVDFILPSGGQ